ncbi:hypothetical protein ACNI3Q_10590 [Sphingomonas sp. FW199]|uniref:beta-xylosidase family glycoside hydrolase n=1 Tax=Sphingomonas sp. FW199 TaxID=3400217 RepID=UPI003CFB57A2
MSPVHWVDDWPVWGTPGAPGRVPERAAKPIAGQHLAQPRADDDFAAPRLGLQWQWNHNPQDDRWSLTERPGFLRLKATKAPELWLAPNTLVQKAQGPRSRAIAAMDLAGLKPGDRCGLTLFGKYSGGILAERSAAGETLLTMEVTEDQGKQRRVDRRITAQPVKATRLWMRLDMDFTSSRASAAYSQDGERWQALGGSFPMQFDWRTGTFQGEQIALACYNPAAGDGQIDVDWFRLMPGPAVP